MPVTVPGNSTYYSPYTSATASGIDPTTLTTTTASDNLSAMGLIQQLTDQINQLNIASQQAANVSRIPGEAGLEATSSANIANLLAGQVSPSTINLLGQQSAERGVMSGSPTGASTNASYLRALGLTSEQLQAQGQTELSAAVARNPAATITDPTKQMLTPQQLGELQLQQQQLALEADRIAAQRSGGGTGSGTGGGTGGGTSGGAGGAPAAAATNWANLFPTETATTRKAGTTQQVLPTGTLDLGTAAAGSGLSGALGGLAGGSLAAGAAGMGLGPAGVVGGIGMSAAMQAYLDSLGVNAGGAGGYATESGGGWQAGDYWDPELGYVPQSDTGGAETPDEYGLTPSDYAAVDASPEDFYDYSYEDFYP